MNSNNQNRRIAGVDVDQLLRNLEESSIDEGSRDLYCRCVEAAAVLRALLEPQRQTIAVFEGYVDGEPMVTWRDRKNMPPAGALLYLDDRATISNRRGDR